MILQLLVTSNCGAYAGRRDEYYILLILDTLRITERNQMKQMSSTKVWIKAGQSKTSLHCSDQWFIVFWPYIVRFCDSFILFFGISVVYPQCTKSVSIVHLFLSLCLIVWHPSFRQKRGTHIHCVLCVWKGFYVSSAWITGECLVGLASYFQQKVGQTPQFSVAREWC